MHGAFGRPLCYVWLRVPLPCTLTVAVLPREEEHVNFSLPWSHRPDSSARERPVQTSTGQATSPAVETETPLVARDPSVQDRAVTPVTPTPPVVLIAATTRAPWRAWARELTARGFRVVVSHDPSHARILAEEHQPQVALLAFGGDGFDNYWLTQELRHLDHDSRIAIVVWGRSAGSELAFAELAGADACVMPPSTLEALLEKVLTLSRAITRSDAGRERRPDR